MKRQASRDRWVSRGTRLLLITSFLWPTVGTSSCQPPAETITETDLSATAGEELSFFYDIPAGATLLAFAVGRGEGDPDLYVGHEYQPTISEYDCRSAQPGNQPELCTGAALAHPEGGRYFVTIHAVTDFEGVQLKVSYRLPPPPVCGNGLVETGEICDDGNTIPGDACDASCVPTLVREDCDTVDALRQPFFGDLHVHTSRSLDADMQGTRLDPDEAYLFAKGQTVDIQPYDENGNALRTLTIDRPLDFAMVSDHAEFFGESSICEETNPPPQGLVAEYNSPTCVSYRRRTEDDFEIINSQLSKLPNLATGLVARHADVCGEDGQTCFDESITFWNEIQQATDSAYDRTSACTFTTFVGYEWTGSPEGKNLHRNIVFQNATVPTRPTSYFEAPYIESLWDALENDCTASGSGCDFLTIPHNSNLSTGLFFKDQDRNGQPYDQALALRRQTHEPLIEVMQHKGQSECSTTSSPADELCGFEVLTYNNLAGPALGVHFPPKDKDYIREALKKGLAMEQDLGANPFKHGMIGSTDTHLGTPGAVAEEGYPGHGGAGTPAREGLPSGLVDIPDFNPGGLTVLWAEENSRESLFAAMRRREAYATSGTRPVVRFFGGFGLDPTLCSSSTQIEDADAQGVPMGSDLPPFVQGESPRFFVSAIKDSGTINQPGIDLQRIQIVKGWVDANGDPHELVYEVAGDPENGATVDINTCEPQGAGFAELCSVWTDPDFDPSERAFYYARVLENPTCRWTKFQCNAGGVDCSVPATFAPGSGFEGCCDGELPAFPDTIQERAWTSPIWFTP